MEYKCKEGMMDNRMVKDSHQEGISRVMQKGGMKKPKMTGKMNGSAGSESNWKRSGASLTPRKA
jgi:hypothetical protein